VLRGQAVDLVVEGSAVSCAISNRHLTMRSDSPLHACTGIVRKEDACIILMTFHMSEGTPRTKHRTSISTDGDHIGRYFACNLTQAHHALRLILYPHNVRQDIGVSMDNASYQHSY